MSKRAVGAHYGVIEWAAQLLTAAVMVVCILYLIGAWIILAPGSHADLVSFIGNELVRVPLMLFVLALVWHAWIGAKSIIMDYLHWDWFRLLKLAGTACYFVLCTVWAASVLWSAGG